MKVVEEIVKRAYLDDGCVLSSDETQPLVRCKDCKWWHHDELNPGLGVCGQGYWLHDDDWFCADGQRAENAR